MVLTSPGFTGQTNAGFANLTLSQPGERKRSQQEIAQALTKSLGQIPGVKAFVSQEQTISTSSQGGSLPVQIILKHQELDSLRKILPLFLEKAQADPTFSVVDVDLKFTKPQLDLDVDRDRLQALGVTPYDLANTLQLAYGSLRFGYFERAGKQYQIIGEIDSAKAASPSALENLYLRNSSGQFLSVAGLVEMKERSVPPQLYRTNRYLSATISAGLAPGKSLGDGVASMNRIADDVLNSSFSTELAGSSRDFAESSSSLMQVFLLALLIVYLILAAQFESFRDPLIIMLTVPLALAGALGSLWLTGNTLNLFSQIGLVMLIGLVTKNGILIVEFANQRREAGLSIVDAVKDAAQARLRPILMTTLCTILGILPIALSLGASSKARAPMGVAVVGGLSFSLILTLVVVPAMYVLIAPKTLSSQEDA
jgi:multidrug efflux pump subunit AcrB